MSSGPTPSIFISNIPENFGASDVYALLSQAGVTGFKEHERVRLSKDRGSGTETGRYMVVQFDNPDLAAAAIEALSNINLMINQKPHQIYFSPFVQDLAKRIKAKTGMMVVQNLPKDVTVSGLRSVFSTFGTVLSAKLVSNRDTRVKGAEDKTQAPIGSAMGYVMFLSDEEADRAVRETNGKFLGVNKVTSSRYLTAEERISNTNSIFIKNIPPEYADDLDKFKQLMVSFCGKPLEALLEEYYLTSIIMRRDSRPEPFRTDNSWCVVKARGVEDAERIIKGFADNAEKYNIQACKFLSRGLRSLQLKRVMRENFVKYCSSKRNISIYGLKLDLDQKEFERRIRDIWGEDVYEIKFPPKVLDPKLDQAKFHVNVLFSTADMAKEAIQRLREEKSLLGSSVVDEKLFEVDYYEPGPQTRLNRQGAPKDFKISEKRNTAFPSSTNK
ncbi:putative Polyadenylate-binding protein [Giardia duodenalis]|uniref:Polyadenylate-binding protein n=1 Tax=Giardia intestinalis (strain ATCC 50803 / WB clone C6) TaxID=184922 RepID=A8BKJ8_GIAIC|nr:putative Polyadenylate-binding protein [Giardia intestinalis]KAE8301478.1 putative Polyadenylate-binding protein [Giardia intestinalis]|eukprot:XP_001706544.1 Polyadenylate-binding protein, putative [Giardia lamblia ATCC 50803]